MCCVYIHVHVYTSPKQLYRVVHFSLWGHTHSVIMCLFSIYMYHHSPTALSHQVVVVSDKCEEIAEEVRRFATAYDYVLTTGGVGPTHDDITIEGECIHSWLDSFTTSCHKYTNVILTTSYTLCTCILCVIRTV